VEYLKSCLSKRTAGFYLDFAIVLYIYTFIKDILAKCWKIFSRKI